MIHLRFSLFPALLLWLTFRFVWGVDIDIWIFMSSRSSPWAHGPPKCLSPFWHIIECVILPSYHAGYPPSGICRGVWDPTWPPTFPCLWNLLTVVPHPRASQWHIHIASQKCQERNLRLFLGLWNTQRLWRQAQVSLHWHPWHPSLLSSPTPWWFRETYGVVQIPACKWELEHSFLYSYIPQAYFLLLDLCSARKCWDSRLFLLKCSSACNSLYSSLFPLPLSS